jgi:hypothetical protein
MRALGVIAAVAALALWGYGAFTRVTMTMTTTAASTANACRPGTNCAECHEGSVPRTHTAAFVELDHGPAALAGRQSCLGCHEPPACDECHRRTPPPWHTDAFRHPGRGAAERSEHGRAALERGSNCLECHDNAFQSQCATCHQRSEWPR